jgi:hypothetical protein
MIVQAQQAFPQGVMVVSATGTGLDCMWPDGWYYFDGYEDWRAELARYFS